MKNGKKLALITGLILMGIFSLTLFAQDKKDDLSSKMKMLDGKVEKITVKVDGKDVVFEGKEAESLAKKLKMFSKAGNMIWVTKEGDKTELNNGNVSLFKFKSDDGDDNVKENKKVEVRIDKEDKKVTVTTEKDGKEDTKVYEGEEAEKYLKEHEAGTKIEFKFKDGDDADANVFYFKSGDDDDNCCCYGKRMRHSRKMRMKMHDGGAKKIIIEKKVDKDDKDSDSK